MAYLQKNKAPFAGDGTAGRKALLSVSDKAGLVDLARVSLPLRQTVSYTALQKDLDRPWSVGSREGLHENCKRKGNALDCCCVSFQVW